jgi:malate dehydrogenase
MSKAPVKVVITGGAGNIGSFASFFIAQGAMLGPDQPIDLRLLEIPQAMKALEGAVMELNDGAFPLINSIVATSDYKEAFDGVEIALLIGARPRSKGMDRADLLKANAAIFKGQGEALNRYAARNLKCLVVGNPANTNALIASHYAPNLSSSCFTAMTRLDQNRACSMVAGKTQQPVSNIRNLVVWGNHSKTMYPDLSYASLDNFPTQGVSTPLRAAVNDDAWLDNEFTPAVKGRGSAIIAARGKSSAASAANAAIDHMRDWVLGTAPGKMVSMGVPSDGSYGIPKGIVYSFPCVCANGNWSIVQGLPVSPSSRVAMDKTAQELLSERASALGTPSSL